MGWRSRLADPWGALVAVTAGGVAWAVLPGAAMAVPIGIGVAAAVFGAKIAADALLGLRAPHAELPRAPEPTALPDPRRGTPARALLDRAEKALQKLDATVESAAASATREQLRAIRDEAAGTRAGIRRLAGQAAAFAEALDHVPAGRLEKERRRLASVLRQTRNPEAAAQHRAALGGVEQQLAARARLAEAHEITVAKLQSITLGVEGLGTRAIELVALAAGTDHLPEDRRIDDLADELEALRLGIADVERRTRPALAPEPPATSG
ncbi:hypothetical protein [Pseudonocardia sp.]|uniref:hypothetical protein n=1 Tax=Pseudonocardia sp. TaxID=60912 RepID=UPI003D14108D